VEAAKDSSSVAMENCSDDDGASGEAARPRIAQGLVNCGDDDDNRMVESGEATKDSSAQRWRWQ
jgi:hypothetical protein